MNMLRFFNAALLGLFVLEFIITGLLAISAFLLVQMGVLADGLITLYVGLFGFTWTMMAKQARHWQETARDDYAGYA